MKEEDGQALIIVTIILFVVLYITLSTIQRRSFDLQAVRSSSNSSQALSQAQTGVSNSLSSIAPGTSSSCTGNLSVCDTSGYYDLKVTTSSSDLQNIYASSGDSLYIDVAGYNTMKIDLKPISTSAVGSYVVARYYDSQNDLFGSEAYKFDPSGNPPDEVNINNISTIRNIQTGNGVSHPPQKVQLTFYTDGFYSISLQ